MTSSCRLPFTTLPAAALLLVLAADVREAGAQTTEPAPLSFGGSVDVQWVLVPVLVRGPRGYVTDLDAEDFELYVDGRRVPDPDFETGSGAPVSAVILQDLSGSVANGGKIEISRQLLNCLIGRSRTGDRFSLATFGNGRVEVQVPSTADLSRVRRALEDWRPSGVTALHDAVAWLPDLDSSGDSFKHVAILITDGVDNASTLPASTARELVRRAELPVYVLGLSTGSPYALDPEGRKLYRFADVLNLLAHETGGRYLPLQRESEVTAACSAVVEDLRHQYVLSFPTIQAGDGEDHAIEVRVEGRRRRATFRRGYVGGPPAAFR